MNEVKKCSKRQTIYVKSNFYKDKSAQEWWNLFCKVCRKDLYKKIYDQIIKYKRN